MDYDLTFCFTNNFMNDICFSYLYIILYLVILSIGLIGNFMFCLIIKKCPPLHRTHHFFFLAVSVMDIFVCILAIPFSIDSQVTDSQHTFTQFNALLFLQAKMYHCGSCQNFSANSTYLSTLV